MRSLAVKETALGLPSGSLASNGNLEMILFLANVRVKENRKTLLCKRSGGDREICEIEEPFSRAGPLHGGGEGAATRFKKEDGDIPTESG